MAYVNVKCDEGEEFVFKVFGEEVRVNRITHDEESGNYMFVYRMGEGRDYYGSDDFILVIRGIPVDLHFSRHDGEVDGKKAYIWSLYRYVTEGDLSEREIFDELGKAVEVYDRLCYTEDELNNTQPVDSFYFSPGSKLDLSPYYNFEEYKLSEAVFEKHMKKAQEDKVIKEHDLPYSSQQPELLKVSKVRIEYIYYDKECEKRKIFRIDKHKLEGLGYYEDYHFIKIIGDGQLITDRDSIKVKEFSFYLSCEEEEEEALHKLIHFDYGCSQDMKGNDETPIPVSELIRRIFVRNQ